MCACCFSVFTCLQMNKCTYNESRAEAGNNHVDVSQAQDMGVFIALCDRRACDHCFSLTHKQGTHYMSHCRKLPVLNSISDGTPG